MPMLRACWNCLPMHPLAEPLAAYLGLPDASFELKLTPNRPDCLGLLGLAHDVARLVRQSRARSASRPQRR